jgi:mannosyltransferase OCH1-like enzyme
LTSSARCIPPRIAQYWDHDEVPADLARLAETCRDNNPNCEYQIYSARSALEWLQARELREATEAFVQTRELAQRVDLFRLAWLAEEGGYWIDIDGRCVAPINLIDPGGRDLIAYQEDIGSAGNSLIGSSARHPLIVAALRTAVQAIRRRDSDIHWLSTGPGLLTRIFASAVAADLERFVGPSGPLILERPELFTAVRIHCADVNKHLPIHANRPRLGKIQDHAPKLNELLSLVGL